MYTDSIKFIQGYHAPVITRDISYELHSDNGDTTISITGNPGIADMVIKQYDYDSIIYNDGRPIEANHEVEAGLDNYNDFLCIKRHFEKKGLMNFYWAFTHKSVIDYLLNREKFMPQMQMKTKLNECLVNLGIGRVVMDPQGNLISSKPEDDIYILVQDKAVEKGSTKNMIDFLICAGEIIDNFFIKHEKVHPREITIYDSEGECVDKYVTKNRFCISLDTARQILENIEDITYLFKAKSR